jgi:acyl carrier protein
MQNLISEDRVIAEIMKIAVETLRVPEGKATADSSFVRDLGAESLDFLDIDYRLEQAFGIKMARHFFLEHVEEMFGEGAAIDEDGRLTKNALTLLRTRYGEENLPDLSNGLDMDQVPPLITIRSMADAVRSIMATLPERCPACNAGQWKTDDGTHILCGACGEAAPFTNGDDLIKSWLRQVQDQTGLFTS